MASAAGSGQLQSREEGERDLDCPSFAEREAPPRRGWRVKQRSALRASETSAQCFSANWSNSVQQVKSKAPKTEDQSLQEETKRLCAKTPWCLGFLSPARICQWLRRKKARKKPQSRQLPCSLIRINPSAELVPFLPPQLPKDAGKKTLVLDLDETLVRSSLVKPRTYTFVVTVNFKKRPRQIYIKRRPGVTKFLKEMSKLYEVVIFTASVSGYADLVVDKIDPHKLCSYRLFREYCTYQSGAFIKDLSLLGRELRNVIIIDNSTKAYLWHMENAIPIKSWFDDPNDTELLDLIPILRSLATVDDIRPMIREALLRYF